MMKFLLGAAAALALLAATPAAASCCENCNHNHKAEAAAQTEQGAVAQADKKDQKGCTCDHSKSKDCKCEKCTCADCPVHGKKAEEKPKKS